jgi:lysophosphatidate acyltransferase
MSRFVKNEWMVELTIEPVLPPIQTQDLTSGDVDGLTQSTRESMLKTLAAMSHAQKNEVDFSRTNGVSSAIEI